MVCISQYPYFSFDDQLKPLLEPLYSQTPIILLAFKRCFPKLKQILVTISSSQDMVSDIYSKEMYRYGYLTNDPAQLESAFHMLDHVNFGSFRNMSNFMRDQHKFAHGLSIVQKHKEYCDVFIFGSVPENSSINNFYLNKKDMFKDFIAAFYRSMETALCGLSQYKISLPQDIIKDKKSSHTFSPRQLECAELMIKGLTAKEIAKKLIISPRTVNEYIDILRKKTNAKNRAQLIYFLRNN